MTWDVAQDGEADVDEQIGTTARYQEDADGWAEDGDEDDEEGGGCVRHCALVCGSFVEDGRLVIEREETRSLIEQT